jgi:hypothetical protein
MKSWDAYDYVVGAALTVVGALAVIGLWAVFS